MPTITESREDYCRDNLYQENLSKIVVDRNRVESSVIADLAYLIAGLVTTTQFLLVPLYSFLYSGECSFRNQVILQIIQASLVHRNSFM